MQKGDERSLPKALFMAGVEIIHFFIRFGKPLASGLHFVRALVLQRSLPSTSKHPLETPEEKPLPNYIKLPPKNGLG